MSTWAKCLTKQLSKTKQDILNKTTHTLAKASSSPQPPTEPTAAEIAAANLKATTDIPECARLLRQMYALELLLWGSAERWTKDPAQKDRLVAQSSALMAEVKRIVRGWEENRAVRWAAEERVIVDEIYEVVRAYGERGEL
ncbi:hypothetical protein QBC34DRAFT_382362 [Podospora aff. communis PSN243]|uniref:Uncharacterized protein n=1 Tax=Podospora aff. communis PSN243 TaxID=3040156 RepID=A0AAV9GHJ9_9PEZI|nr:hypothetical protein QBC34DRAFT_382362 [Podospora aff. communis PSN243]